MRKERLCHQEPDTKTEEAGSVHFRAGGDTGRMTVPEMTEYLTEMKMQEESLQKRRQEVEGEIVTVDEYIRLNAYGSHSGEVWCEAAFRVGHLIPYMGKYERE